MAKNTKNTKKNDINNTKEIANKEIEINGKKVVLNSFESKIIQNYKEYVNGIIDFQKAFSNYNNIIKSEYSDLRNELLIESIYEMLNLINDNDNDNVKLTTIIDIKKTINVYNLTYRVIYSKKDTTLNKKQAENQPNDTYLAKLSLYSECYLLKSKTSLEVYKKSDKSIIHMNLNFMEYMIYHYMTNRYCQMLADKVNYKELKTYPVFNFKRMNRKTKKVEISIIEITIDTLKNTIDTLKVNDKEIGNDNLDNFAFIDNLIEVNEISESLGDYILNQLN